MKLLRSCCVAAFLLVGGCATAPKVEPVAVVAAPAPKKAEPPYRWHNGFALKALDVMTSRFGSDQLKPGEYKWAEDLPSEGETRIVVDLLHQLAFVYRDDVLVGMSTISSGKKGKETPLGFWSVQRKHKDYRSRKYDNAPMPFAQMIDDHGIALHGGKVPGFPASRGCVRLPVKFAEKLFTMTKVGTKVVIEG